MRLSTVFMITAVILLIFAVVLIVSPTTLLNVYGITLEPGPAATALGNVARLIGATQLGLAVLAWLMRNEGNSKAGQAVLLSFTLLMALQGIWFLLNVIAGTLNSVGWGSVVLYALLTIGFAYFYFTKPRMSM